jgi:hypothetical protein
VVISLTVVASTDAGSMENEFFLGWLFALPPLLLLAVKLRKRMKPQALHRPKHPVSVESNDWPAKKWVFPAPLRLGVFAFSFSCRQRYQRGQDSF